ncbi:MAG: UDP-N-acetylmuramoyl-L-alanyl-D-glutamate--2,6-diaminopimelate ligase [Zetaproteobacteria bacterium]|nr:UDP-N-acetylmuramoyl-L-alanyl-D-glutamate--2,6-diaminopimelate ligase [Zetaproteobacteria bacterium]
MKGVPQVNLAELDAVLTRAGLLVQKHAYESLPKKKANLVTRLDASLKNAVVLLYAGTHFDPHTQVAMVLQQRPACLVVEQREAYDVVCEAGIPAFLVSNARRAWSFLSAHAYGDPQQHLQIYGITGTNGKTSTAWMMAELLKDFAAPLYIGTIGVWWQGECLQATLHTTPDPPELFCLLFEHLQRGGKTVCVEVSSHAIVQEKLAPLGFAGLAWTSFSQDHLDFHGDMHSYWQAKWRVFRQQLSPQGIAVCQFPAVDYKDLQSLRCIRKVHFGLRTPENARAKEGFTSLRLQDRVLYFAEQQQRVQLKVPFEGDYNAENFFCAWQLAKAALAFRGMQELPEQVSFAQIPGRFEVIAKKPFTVVDFAHTPDALARVLDLARQHVEGILWVVFGCGGNRDRGKRAQMGAIAEKKADAICLTSDNPRDEAPENIVADILLGVTNPVKVEVIVDRRQAIAKTIAQLRPQDGVVLAGKGHENTQRIGTQAYFLDDRGEARAALDKQRTKNA